MFPITLPEPVSSIAAYSADPFLQVCSAVIIGYPGTAFKSVVLQLNKNSNRSSQSDS